MKKNDDKIRITNVVTITESVKASIESSRFRSIWLRRLTLRHRLMIFAKAFPALEQVLQQSLI